MMKQNYNNKAKHRSAWFALVLLMITALPITAQTAQKKGDRFQVDILWYEIMDVTAKTVKVTYASEKAATADAKRLEPTSAEDNLTTASDLRGYNGTLQTNAVDKDGNKVETLAQELKYELATGNIYTITVPEKVNYKGTDWTVKAIGSNAFINERRIRKMVLPETIEAIEDAAFYQSGVTILNFPTNLKTIGWRAFYKSSLAPFSLKPYTGGNPKKKGTYTGRNILPIDIPGSTAIGPQAFERCFSLVSVNCPKITFIGYQAFKGTAFEGTIPALANLGQEPTNDVVKAMYNNIPAVTDKRSGVESFAELLTKPKYDRAKAAYMHAVSLEEGTTVIPSGMFKNAFDPVVDSYVVFPGMFSIPTTVNSIEASAFENSYITKLDLTNVKKIGAKAFANCTQSGDIVIGEQAEEVGDGAFAGNGKLEAFILKGTTNCKIGAGIFEGCPKLEYIDMRNMKQVSGNEDYLKNLSREFNTVASPNKTITAGLPTHTVVYLPNATSITFATGQDVNFVKFDGTCTKLSLQDGAEYEFPYTIKATQAVYNKCNMTTKKAKIERGYNITPLEIYHYTGDNNSLTSYRDFSKFADGKHCFTIFLPYAVTLPEGIRAYMLDYKDKKDYFTYEPIPEMPEYPNGYPLESGTEFYVFQPIEDSNTLEANKPYLLRITNGNSCSSEIFMANNVDIAKSPTDKFEISKGGRFKPVGFAATKAGQSYSFQGSTEMIPPEAYKNDNNRPWVLNIVNKNTLDGKKDIDVWKQMYYVSKGAENVSIPPFRGFVNLLPGASGAKQFIVLSESKPTGINDVTNDADALQGAQRIYTIDGRYVGTNFDSLPSGIYIMKGKKTLKTK